MSKNRSILAIFTIVGVVISFVSLKFGFCISAYELLEQALLAAFTGCIFSLFGGAVVWIGERKQIKAKQGELLSNLYTQVTKLSVDKYANYVPRSLEENRRSIVNLYQLLHTHLNENVWINSGEVTELKDSIFDLSLCILELDRCYDSCKMPRKIDVDAKLKDINRLKGNCTNLITKIQELL